MCRQRSLASKWSNAEIPQENNLSFRGAKCGCPEVQKRPVNATADPVAPEADWDRNFFRHFHTAFTRLRGIIIWACECSDKLNFTV